MKASELDRKFDEGEDIGGGGDDDREPGGAE